MSHRFRGYFWGVVAVGAATAVCQLLHGRIHPANQILVYLAAVSLVAFRFGRGESVLASVLGVGLFDLLFVHPEGTLAVSDPQDLITFAVMLGVSLLISGLASRLRDEATAAQQRERRTNELYEFTRGLVRRRNHDALAGYSADRIREIFETDTALYLGHDALRPAIASTTGFENGEKAASALAGKREPGYLVLSGTHGAVGVLVVRKPPRTSEQHHLLETFAGVLGLAIERADRTRETHEARVQTETERIRSALLSSISHDIRTPLTTIAGAASSLQAGMGEQGELVDLIYEESIHLNQQVQKLLDMTRLQTGGAEPQREWHSVEDLLGTAILRARHADVRMEIPPDLPLLFVDGRLLEQVFVNLLENANRHAPGARVQVRAGVKGSCVRVEFADEGPGIPEGAADRIFDRFSTSGGEGYGLGLAIARAILRLHGGRIWAENRSEGGATFHVELPLPDSQPEIPRE